MWVIRMFGSEHPLFSSKGKASEIVRDPIVELWEVGRFLNTLQVEIGYPNQGGGVFYLIRRPCPLPHRNGRGVTFEWQAAIAESWTNGEANNGALNNNKRGSNGE